MICKLEIQQLIDQDKFDEALKVIEHLEKKKDLSLEDQLSCQLLKSQLLSKTGETTKGVELARETLAVVQARLPGDRLMLVDAIIRVLEALLHDHQFGGSRKILLERLQLVERGERAFDELTSSEPREIAKRAASLQKFRGILHRLHGEFDRAEKCLQKSWELHEEVGNKKGLVEEFGVLWGLARVFKFSGEQEKRLETNREHLKVSEELGDRKAIAEAHLLTAQTHQATGNIPAALEHLQESHKIIKDLPADLRITSTLFSISDTYQNVDEFDTAADILQRVYQQVKGFPRTARVGELFYSIGISSAFLQRKSRRETFDEINLDGFQRSLDIFDELSLNHRSAWSNHCIGDIYGYSKGEMDIAIDYYTKCMVLFEEAGDKFGVALSLQDIGVLHHLRGELEPALDSMKKSLPLWEETGNKFMICGNHIRIGDVYFSMGNNAAALEHYKQSLKILEGIKPGETMGANIYREDIEALTYHALIVALLDTNDRKEAKRYLEKFKQVHEENKRPEPLIDQGYKLSEALVLKTSARIKEKARAQQLLQEIIAADPADPRFGFEPKTRAMLDLCDLLLYEMQASPDGTPEKDEVFEEIKLLLDELVSRAQQQHSFPLLVSTLVLRARFALIEGKAGVAMQLLDQAKITAEEKALDKLIKEIASEEKQLTAQLDTWERLIQDNVPLQERLTHARLEKYIAKALKVANVGQQPPS